VSGKFKSKKWKDILATLASDEEIEMKERMNNGTKHEKDQQRRCDK
jgi:hypothetical protein